MQNTVKGKQRGKPYPPRVKAAVVADMLLNPNWHEVAQKHGVPESTLRGWGKDMAGLSAAERRERWAEAQRLAMGVIADRATAHAVVGVELMGERLGRAKRDAARAEEINGALIAGALGAEEKAQAKREKELRPPMGDYPLVNTARALVSIAAKAYAMSGQEAEAGGVVLEFRVVD